MWLCNHGSHVDVMWKIVGWDFLVWEAMGRSINQMKNVLVTLFKHDKEFFVAADCSCKLHGRQ